MEKIYSSSYRCDTSVFVAAKKLFSQAYRYKWQIWQDITKKLHATYKQDAFGLFWSIVMPIIPMTVYMILAHIKVLNTVDSMPFVYYIGMGMLVWLLMSDIIRTFMTTIKSNKPILTATNFPVFPALLSQLGQLLHDTALHILVVAAIVIFYQIDIHFSYVLLSLLSLIPAILFALGVGMIVSIFDAVIQDTRRIVLIVMRYGIFISSVIFPFPTEGVAGLVNKFNFFNTFVNATRDLLHHGSVSDPLLFWVTSMAGIVIFLIGAKLIYVMDYKIRAYL